MSLQQPTQKMSKSHADPRSRIVLTDTPEEIRKKVMSALTDSTNSVSYDPEARPGVSNLLEMISIFDEAGRSPQEIAQELGGGNLRALKEKAADAINGGLSNIRERYLEMLAKDDGKYIDHVAEQGARKARANAEETMEGVRAAVGL